jgi:hypothetical protein
MSKERELLVEALEWMEELNYVYADSRNSGDRLALELKADINKIEKLLAKPEQEGVYQKLLKIEDGIEVEILPSELWQDGYETGRKDSQKRKPLSDEEIFEIGYKAGFAIDQDESADYESDAYGFLNEYGYVDNEPYFKLVRAIEKAHDITGVDDE